MKQRLTKKEKRILDTLDKLLAGQSLDASSSFLEEKLLQTLNTFKLTEEKYAQQQQATSKLISDISHQIKTPLSALSLNLELAEDLSLTPEEQADAFLECRHQTNKIMFLSDAMFKVVRLENGLIAVKKTQNNIVATVMSAVSAIKPMAENKGLSIDVVCSKFIAIPHDPLWTKEAILNVLDNAVKYTDKGGIKITIEQGGIYTRIDIIDTGIGIANEDYTKIFSRFYRARAVGTELIDGTGLGLPIAREILRQQGGNITVSSVKGKGSIFSLFLQNC